MITETDAAVPFDPVYFETVFVVPRPPASWPPVFAIVTAHNPEGLLAPESANNQYDRALGEYLRSQGIESFAVVGASPDLRHHEAGRGFAFADLESVASISAKFRQDAFFVVADGIVFLCNDASGRGWRVARWDERVRSRSR
jgi:hypothetical protein